ncbi:hypothetical protein OWR29_39535 [Actinoplanes sp. Pm04-4]|uniref:Uncharacterized protein n=1 Tax=Paractinoplanes pyxinae TaxID=2997416 RepID=A0ABT4BC80_9ACTN|nr:hypothetical protein [Actinoplanes pyxinae]MCY1144125.1 hypothetical protein [Actinoplanes pyxinae]
MDFTTSDGAASRVLLSLTNTGGKSTLITLVCSLVVPASRAQVGGKNLGDYVLTGDTSHILCEWEDATTGTRTVTGAVMEWKDGRRQPGHKQRSTTNMHRAWYLFRTGPGLPGIDDLPFVTDGRRTGLETYLAQVTDLMSSNPRTQWVLTRIQTEWTQALQDRTSIDPVLFSYQMRMNDSEAGAEKLLASFDSPDNVVRFFIAALNDDREITDFTGKLGPYAELAAQRPYLDALAGFGTELAPRVELLAQRTAALDEKVALALKARVAGGEHAAALSNRVAQDTAALSDLTRAVEAAVRELAAARREYGQISDIRLQLQLERARHRLAEADAAVLRRAGLAADAARERDAWEAVDRVLEVDVAREQRDAAKIAYEAAHAELAPLREQVTRAAAAVAGRLNGLIAEADAVAEAADEQAREGEQALGEALDLEKEAEGARDAARQELARIDAAIQTAEAATEAAYEAGWLLPGERPARCLRRWHDAIEAAAAEIERQDGLAKTAETAFDDLQTDLDNLEEQLVELRTAANADRIRLEAFDAQLAAIAANDTVTALLGGTPADVSDVGRVVELAGQSARRADERAADHERQVRAARDELAHLDEAGTAPTGADVLAVLDILLAERIGAVTGLDWIERNIIEPTDRPAFIAARPEIAGAVIVSDPHRFAAAITHLTQAKPRTRVPVTVTVAPTSTSSAAARTDPGPRHVVVPHRATWDREWARAARAELETTQQQQGQKLAEARTAAEAHRAAAASCSAFTDSWPATTRSALLATSTSSADQVESAVRRKTTLSAERDRQRQAAAQHRRLADQARREHQHARDTAAQAAQLVAIADTAATAADQRAHIATAEADAVRWLALAEENRAAAKARMSAGLGAAAQARADRRTWQTARDELGVEDAAADPGGNLAVVQAAWESLRRELTSAEQGLREAEFLNRAQRHLDQAIERRDRFAPLVVQRAVVLARSTSASSRDALIAAQNRSRAEADEAAKAHLRAVTEQENAATEVREATPASSDRQNHIDFSNTPQWLPATPTDIPHLLERLEIHNAELLARREAAEQAQHDAEELHAAVVADISAFNDTIGMWPAELMHTDRIYAGGKDTARIDMRTLFQAHRQAETAERTARDLLGEAVTNVRAGANEPRWRDLDAPAAARLRALPDADLITEAQTLAHRIQSMAESARADLNDLDTHRTILRDGLLTLCREQRRLLREVTRASRLPAGLGEFSDHPAIKIRFEEATDDEAAARLADRIDAWATELAANPKRASSAEVRARWLADAVRDTVLDRLRAGAWSIEILKPRIDGKVIYCPPDRIPQEFSGGQVLTLAVLVYCALSGVRSTHRPGGARPPGTLLLDNPFGAASAETLIAMQHRLAAHTGLQLVCATGLHDAGVDAAFTGPGSVVVKLRNDGDLRRNLSFLRLRARIVDGIDIAAALTAGRDPNEPKNWVDATTYEIRR